ncbi:MAG: dihydroneopterin triphosphate diphosphatase [Phycisphaerales bacterium]|jgi:8-oxo-dGTP pyrophosphatase MutT (NUDIX family)|nr:dihydroneopterin triphosphate diphosphatase [Phycisphaerales bacterium]
MTVKTHKIVVFVARPTVGGRHEFLQLRRVGDEPLAGTWQTVRGSIESGETAAAAAIRELKEEIAIRPAEFYRLGTVETFYDLHTDAVWHSAAFFALLAADSAVTLNEEHDALRWIDETKIDQHLMWPSEKPLIKEIRDELLGNGLCKPYLRIDI